MLLSFSGCAGGGSSYSTKPSTYTISGTISPSSGGSGATLTLSGPATGSTTADGSGNYSFTGLTNGTYVVTPSHSGYTFNPSSLTVAISGANATGVNFAVSQQASNSVALSWVASISVVSGYNVYSGASDGGPCMKINSSLDLDAQLHRQHGDQRQNLLIPPGWKASTRTKSPPLSPEAYLFV